MLFTLEALPAAEGDCLLLHWGTAREPRLAVVDGGPRQTYELQLRPRLEAIAAALGVDRLPLELVMVSHADNDHITGIKKLLQALRREIERALPPDARRLRLTRLWYNVFNDVLGDSIDRYYETLTQSVQASVAGEPNPALIDQLATIFEDQPGRAEADARQAAHDISLLLAGHAQGRAVRDDHRFLFDQNQSAVLNHPFRDAQGRPTLITLDRTPAPVTIAGLKFKILGPRQSEIEALQRQFDAFIRAKGLTTEAVLAAYADESITNLSSLVCLVQLGRKRILLTGDARGDTVLAGLEQAGLLPAGGGRLRVDILKVPHHGSDRNVTVDFFKRIVAKTYLFSGDGKHGNPERATFEWLATARGKRAQFRVLLTYPVAEIDENRRADYLRKGLAWVPAENALSAGLERLRTEGYRFSVETGAPVKIDLGDEAVTW